MYYYRRKNTKHDRRVIASKEDKETQNMEIKLIEGSLEDEKTSSLPEVERIELSKRAKNRNKRFNDFETFYGKAKEIFYPYKESGDRERYFESLYNLAVCPGSRMGGRESRVVEFFWGHRLFDKTEGVSADLRWHVKFESEAGATMFFFKNDDGYVSIQLYPAHTDNRRPIEDFIFWEMRVDPSKLLKARFQRHCWKSFMAYMEVTSLDGDPDIFQKLHVWYLRHFKYVIVDKKETPLKYMVALNKIGWWVSTVTFSGLAIFLFQLWLTPNPSEHHNIQDIRNTAIQTETEIENLRGEVTAIKESQDSLIKVLCKSGKKAKGK